MFKDYLKARKHGRSWEGVALESDAALRGWSRVGAASEFFFFFFLRFALTRLDSRRHDLIRAESASIRAELG